MSSHPLDGDLYVTPLYLAGSTFIGDPALQPLLDHGFNAQSDEIKVTWNHLRGCRF
ncbi:hypothetical protein PV417_32045 [Streptomyces sp. ME19-03-3]|nr:hypothetical protein [Streptomyces sp. ME19-03-3]